MKSKDEKRENQIEEDIKKFSRIVYLIAYKNTNSVHDAEDVFQDVFIKYCKYFNKLSNDEHKKRWLMKATKHTAINFNKHKKRTNCLELDENIMVNPLEDIDSNSLPQFMNSLKDTYKVVLNLYYFNNLHIKEICQKLDITESAVKTRLTRGRHKLKEIIDEVGL